MSTFNREIFRKRIKNQRYKVGLKRQQDLAKLCEISLQSVNYYESGDRLPDAAVLYKLASSLQCSSDYLIQLEQAATHDKAYIVDQTGLSDKAVDTLCEMQKKQLELNGTSDWIELYVLSTLLSSELAHDFLRTLYYYVFDDLFHINIKIDGKIRILPLEDVVSISSTDQNHNTGHGVFRETITKALVADNIIRLQRFLSDFRDETRKNSIHIENNPEIMTEINKSLARSRLEISKE